MRKVHLGLQALGDEFMLGELFAVVKGQRLAVGSVGPKQRDDGLRHLRAVARTQLGCQGVARFSLHQRDQHALVPFANDGVALPVANAAALVHNGGTLLNTNTVLQGATTLAPTGMTFTAYLLASQITDQIPALLFVSVGVPVNALGTDGDGIFQLESPAALLGREMQAQVGIHMAPLIGAEVARIAPRALALSGLFVRANGFVAAGPCIAFEFTRNRRAISLQLCRYARQTDVLPLERVDLVSFVLGQVFVGHGAR